jgi:proteasome lid subunit RPN8/RPN11
MEIPQALYDRMVTHARAEAPDECCGMIGTRGAVAVSLYEAENTAHTPLRYELSSRDQLRIQKALDAADLELGGIYHSHTRSAPYPSQTDINLAFYPGAVYIIIGLATGPEADVRAYRIVDGQVREEPLVVR